MARWGSAYFLEEKVNDQEIWNIIRKTLQQFFPFTLPEKVSENLFFKEGDCTFSWDNSEESDLILTDLDCNLKVNGIEDEFNLVYEKNSTLPIKNQNLHRLIIQEEYHGDGLPMLCAIMPIIKQYVPKFFVLDSIRNEKWRIHKAYPNIRAQQRNEEEEEPEVKIDLNELSKTSFTARPNSIKNEIYSKYSSLEALRASYVKPKEKKDEKSEKEREFEENFFLIKDITFYADINDRFWFDEAWIKRFCNEMWFLNAHYNQFVGVRTYVKNVFLVMNPQFEKWNSKRHKGAEAVEAVNKVLDESVEHIISSDRNTFRNEAHIAIVFADKREVCFTEKDHPFSTYEDFRNAIVGTVELDDDKFFKHVNTRFAGQDLVRDDEEVPIAVKQKLNAFLSEHEIDIPTITKLKKDFAALKAEKEEMKKEAEEREKQHQGEIASLEQKLRNAALPVAALSESNDTYKKDIDELKQSIKERESENKKLKDRIALLEKSLQTKIEESDGIHLSIPSSVKPLFKDELTDYLYSLLYGALEAENDSLPQNRADEVNRKRDVVSDLLEKQTFNRATSESEKKIERIDAILRSDAKYPLDMLTTEGFEKVEGYKNHPKFYFYDEKYQLTFPSTPSDCNVAWRELNDICKCCFLQPQQS